MGYYSTVDRKKDKSPETGSIASGSFINLDAINLDAINLDAINLDAIGLPFAFLLRISSCHSPTSYHSVWNCGPTVNDKLPLEYVAGMD
jgi:hypothetical protein